MLKGVITPVVTAFNADGMLDMEGNQRIINRLVDAGVDGILFSGSIGEFFNMSFNEKKDFFKFVVRAVDKRVPVLVGTGGTVMDEVIELTRFASTQGADAAVVISPYYFKLDDDSLYRYYAQVANSSDLPIILYNFPDRTSVNLEPDLVARLAADFPNIIGIKDTVDSISHTRKLIKRLKSEREDFAVFSAYDEYLIQNLMDGGNGVIGGL